MARRRVPTQKQRQDALDAANHACQACGATDLHLDLVSLVPHGDPPNSASEPFGVLCPDCHAVLDNHNPREMEFVAFLASILEMHPDFNRPVVAPKYRGEERLLAPDLLASKDGKSILIEAKRVSFMRRRQIDDVVQKLQSYREAAKPDMVALAFPGRISAESREVLVQHAIEVWDLDYIAALFREQIRDLGHLPFQILFSMARTSQAVVTPAQDVLSRLKQCEPGREQWLLYQKIVRDALELMFCPPLGHPIWESADSSGVNRRDIILPNEAHDGFWAFLRRRYGADYIVVDPKNYKGRVSKAQVLQIANYLKPHGTGMFALIVSRYGEKKNATVTRREQWSVYGKMILTLTDDDLESMLLAYDSGGGAEEVITRVIQEFRLSL